MQSATCENLTEAASTIENSLYLVNKDDRYRNVPLESGSVYLPSLSFFLSIVSMRLYTYCVIFEMRQRQASPFGS